MYALLVPFEGTRLVVVEDSKGLLTVVVQLLRFPDSKLSEKITWAVAVDAKVTPSMAVVKKRAHDDPSL
jgi:hypothetical protein